MSSFTPSTFKSAPWCFNGHAHTILPSLLFNSPHLNYNTERIPTPDDDFLDIDIVKQKTTDAPVAVIFHGLEGSSRRYYVRRMAQKLYERGMHIFAVNFRSCSGEMNSNRRFYHSGETEDPQTVFSWVGDHFPNSSIFAVGFSLGASALLNTIHKNGSESNVEAFAAISTPFDLKRGSINLQNGFNRIYDYRFLRSLEYKLKQKRKTYPDLPIFNGSTLYDFDDQVTAPIHGFKDADDYYRQCSSAFFMDDIQTPGLIIHSRQDPLCPFEYTPAEAINSNALLSTVFPKKGGHVGFWSLPPDWAEQNVANYFSQFSS